MTATAAPLHERLVYALHRLAVHQGHTVPAERLATLAADLAPYGWERSIAALDAHRKASRFFPQFPELRCLLEPSTAPTAGLRGQSVTGRTFHQVTTGGVMVIDPDYRGAPYRFHCDHGPACVTWPEHRERLLGGNAADVLEALNASWRHADDTRRTA